MKNSARARPAAARVWSRKLGAWAGVWMCLVLTTPAHGQGSAADKAAAEALFDEGLGLMREGKYAEACKRLERSQSIEHGLGTMLYLADCYEKLGRTASAWALFREASSLADAEGQRERAESGRRRARALSPRLSRLTVRVPEDHRVDGLEVSRGGQPVPSSVWGTAVPVDPGTYRIQASAPGFRPWSTSVTVHDRGHSLRVEVPRLKAAADESAEPVAEASEPTAPVAAAELDPAAERATPARHMSKRRIAAWSTGAAGGAAVGLGAVFGGLAIAKNNDAEAECEDAICETPEGVAAADDAKRFANTSTAMWAVGGALVGTGLLLYFLEPERDREQTRVSASVSPRHAAITLRGAF